MPRIARRIAGIGASDLPNAAAFDAYIGPAREITVDQQRGIIALHDGVTAGGHQFLKGGGGSVSGNLAVGGNIDCGNNFLLSRTTHPYGYITRPNAVGHKNIGFSTDNGSELDNFNVLARDTKISGSLSLHGATKGIEIGAVGAANSPYIDFHSGAAGVDFDARIQTHGGDGTVGGGSLYLTAKMIDCVAHLYPGADNAYSLGANGRRWSTIWAANGVTQTSGLGSKVDIIDSPLGLDFVKTLRPVSYRFKIGGYDVEIDPDPAGGTSTKTTPKPGKRTHYGLIAEEVKDAVDAAGVGDFGGFVLADPSDPESAKALRYDQFIAPLIKAVQELSARVDRQQQTIEQQQRVIERLQAAILL